METVPHPSGDQAEGGLKFRGLGGRSLMFHQVKVQGIFSRLVFEDKQFK